MRKTDKQVDAYILTSAEFAKPVMKHLRNLVHKACPDVEEKMKWSFPTFNYKGGILCTMAAFKQHCSFGFWKASLLKKNGLLSPSDQNAMGQFGRITKLSDLPSDEALLSMIKEAARLNGEGVKLPPKKKAPKKELAIPDYFTKALSKNKKARKTFDGFSYSNKKDYVEWITEAKTEETRNARLKTSVEWMSEGKVRNWKYIKK